MSQIKLTIGAVPATPAAGDVTLYPKSDKKLYIKDDTGAEFSFSPPATTDALTEGATNKYFTDERAQDAVASALTDTATIDLTYTDGTDSITADLKSVSVDDSHIKTAAAITLSKLAALTASRALVSNGSGVVDVSSVTATEIGSLTGVSSNLQIQIDGKQPVDSDLTALAGITSTGIIARTSTGAMSTRTIQQGNGITVTNGSGVAGDPSVALTNTAVTPAVYGSTTQVPAITIDQQGRITNASNTSMTSAGISDFLEAAQDAVGNALTDTATIDFTYADGSDQITADVKAGSLTDTQISSTAAIAQSKMAAMTANRAVITDASGFATTNSVTSTELAYLSGVTSAIQTQLDGKGLAELNDVAISASPVTGQSIYYNSVTDLWSNQTPPMSISGQMAVSLETSVVTLTDAANIAVNASLGNIFTVTLGGNRTLDTPTNSVSGQKIIVRATQDGTGGRTLSYSAGWNLGTDFVGLSLSIAANATDYIGAIYNAITSKWDIVSIMKGY